MEEPEKQKRCGKQESENEAEEKAKLTNTKRVHDHGLRVVYSQEPRVAPGQQPGTTQNSTNKVNKPKSRLPSGNSPGLSTS